MGLLGFLFTFIFVVFFIVLIFGLSILGVILRLFGIGRQRTATFRSSQPETPRQPESASQKKFFSDGEGEYVDFEEV